MPIPSLNLHSRVTKTKESSGVAASDASASNDAAFNTKSVVSSLRAPYASQPSNPNGAKRRSFLPQRGHLNSIPRPDEAPKRKNEPKVSPADLAIPLEMSKPTPTSRSGVVQGKQQDHLEQRSIDLSHVIRSEQHAAEDSAISTRPIHSSHTVSSSSVPQSTEIHRSQSLRRPGLQSQPAPSTNSHVHLRTKSTSTVAIPLKEPSDSRIRAERPKSSVMGASYGAKATTTRADTASTGIRSSTRLAALKRPASTRNRPAATDSSECTALASRPEEPVVAEVRRRELSKEEHRKPLRPAFSTLQQHFTPRKAGKALTSTFLHPTTDAGPCSLPPEIATLQTELLQLHVLHETSAQSVSRWERSAKSALHNRFNEVASLYQIMRKSERQGQEQKNIRALHEWDSGNSAYGLVKHIHILSGPLHELPPLVESGGRFQRLAEDFDRWLSWVKEVWDAREGYKEGRGDLVSAEGLGDSWQAEIATLTRKLTTFSRDLERLTQPPRESSIANAITACKELLDGILEELQIMQAIELGVVAKEKEWIEARLHAIARDIGAHLVEANVGEEAWHM